MVPIELCDSTPPPPKKNPILIVQAPVLRSWSWYSVRGRVGTEEVDPWTSVSFRGFRV